MMRNRSHDTPRVSLHHAFETAWQRTKNLFPKSVRPCAIACRLKLDGLDGLGVVVVAIQAVQLQPASYSAWADRFGEEILRPLPSCTEIAMQVNTLCTAACESPSELRPSSQAAIKLMGLSGGVTGAMGGEAPGSIL